MNLIIEPQVVFDQRHLQAAQNAFAFTAADPHIFNLLRAGPVRIMTAVNKVGRILPSSGKLEKVAIKRRTLKRVGELIGQGKLRRIGRVFLSL